MDVWSDAVATVALIVNGIFAGLVWWSTKKSSDVSKQSYELSRRLQDNEEAKRQMMQNHLRMETLERMEGILTAVESISLTTGNVLLGPIMGSPKDSGLQISHYLEYFDMGDKNEIERFWKEYNQYIQDTFMISIGINKYVWIDSSVAPDEKLKQLYINSSEQSYQTLKKLYDNLSRKWLTD